MVLLPIADEEGNVIDEYDDGREEKKAGKLPAQPSNVTPCGDMATPLPETLPASSLAQTPALPARSAEDPTSFDESDVFIGITLHRADGHAQGRLVSVCIHNFSGQPSVRTFREADLSEKARLDNMQRAIQATMQPFFLDLAERRKIKLEQEAKRAATRQAAAAATTARQTTEAKTATVKSTTPASSPSTAQTGSKAAEKKVAEKPAGKYQQVSMF